MDKLLLIGGPETKELDVEAAGGKAANLSRMAALGLPVPPAFVVPVDLCAGVVAGKRHAEEALDRLIEAGVRFLEERTGRRLGDRRRPLLVSVRSGAARSMPGMLDTVLDVGATAEATLGLVRTTGNPRFAWDCRRRFLTGYAETVLGLDGAPLEARLAALVAEEGAASDRDLDAEALERFAGECLAHVDACDAEVPADPVDQLRAAARAVYRSWESERARTYRRLQRLEDLPGTAVTVQAMVFGNTGLNSGAGVAFSRDPSTGEAEPVVDLLFDAQGEDVVSGRRTPADGVALRERLPEVADELERALATLERAFGDVQDVEFTIENGRLWLLQTRAAKRTPRAALKIAVAHVRQGLIGPAEALARLGDLDVKSLALTRFDGVAEPIASGIPAAPGVAAGRLAFDSATAERLGAAGEPVILARPDTSTADVAGFAAAAGIVTAAGGRTAHAALVARQMGKPCIVGCAALAIDEAGRRGRIDGHDFAEGDWLSIDGDAGTLHPGRAAIVSHMPEADLAEWERWREEGRTGKPARRLA
jgi:pyruvate,orthophosphate dikinase